MRQSTRTNDRNNSPYNHEDIVVDADADAANMDENMLNSCGTPRQVGGAAVAGGIACLVVAGPVIGLIAAGGAAALATSRGKAGDVARAGGDVMSDAGVRLKHFDRKHRVVEKTSKGIVDGCRWVSKQIKRESPQTLPLS